MAMGDSGKAAQIFLAAPINRAGSGRKRASELRAGLESLTPPPKGSLQGITTVTRTKGILSQADP